jgi:hypothetical protein
MRVRTLMLLVLIPIAWLTLALALVSLCRLAARADASDTAAGHLAGPGDREGREAPLLALPGLTVWDCSDPARVRSAARALAASAGSRPAQRRSASRRPVGAGSRARGVHRGTRSLARS